MAILATADPTTKATASRALATAWGEGAMAVGHAPPPPRPARPERLLLRPTKEMAKRRAFGSPTGRLALIHALAHIELNAIDLAWDLVARFAGTGLPREFFDDWVGVAAEEARHFELLAGRLAELGARYGDLPAHDGLWEAAAATAGDLLARLAVVPLVLEARGLDVTRRWRPGWSGSATPRVQKSWARSIATRSVTSLQGCAGSTGSVSNAG